MASLADIPERTYQGAPPEPEHRVSPLQALARHPLAVAIPVVVGLGVAIAVGLLRQPVYTAQARLGIVTVNLQTPGSLGGFGTGASQLSQAYARALTAPQIRSAIAARTRIPESRLGERLSAAPVPNAPVFAVRATGPTSSAAAQLANVASQEMVKYVAAINSTATRADRLLTRYSSAELDLQNALSRRDALTSRFSTRATPARRRALIRAKAAVEVARAHANALQVAYQQSVQAVDAGAVVRVLSTAGRGSSDRGPKLQLLGFLGLIAGLAVGAALALLLTARESRPAVGMAAGPDTAPGPPVRRRRRILLAVVVIAVLVAAAVGSTLAEGAWPPW